MAAGYDLGTAHGKITLDYDGDRAAARAEDDIDKLKVKADKSDLSLKKLGKTLGVLGKGAKLIGIVTALTQAAIGAAALGIQILGIIPNLVSIASLSAALPGIFVGLIAVVGTLKAVFSGVGDTIKAAFDTANPDKFNQALKKLSPEAQKFAKAVQAGVPTLKALQQGMQDAFFSTSNLAAITVAAIGRLKQLSPSLKSVATDLGRATSEVGRFATSAQTLAFVQKAVLALRQTFLVLTPIIQPVLDGIRAVGTVGLQLIPRVGDAVAGLGIRFADFLSGIAADGRLQSWINTAIATLKSLGAIVTNVGSILGSVISTANKTGGGLLNTLALLTGQAAAFLKSAEGSAALTGLFTTILSLAKQLAPVVAALASALIGALAPALQRLATLAGPILLQVIQALAPALLPLTTAIVDLVSAVAPLLPSLGKLAALLVRGIALAVSAIAAELGPLISLLGDGLAGAVDAVTPALAQFVQFLPRAVAFGTQLAAAFAPLIPQVVALAQAFADGLTPVMPQLLDASNKLIPVLIQLATALAGSLTAGIKALIPLIPGLIKMFVGITLAIVTVYSVVLKVITFFANLATSVINLGIAFKNFITAIPGAFSSAFNSVVSFVSSGINSIVAFFAALPGRVFAAIAGFINGFPALTQAAANKAAFAVGAAIGTMITFLVTLPGRAASAIASLGARLAAIGASAMAALNNLIIRGIATAISIITTLPGRAAGAIGALPGVLRNAANSASAALHDAIVRGVNSAISSLATLAGRAKSAVGNLSGALVSAGRDLVLGLINGIKGAIGAAVSAAASVGHSVINGIKSTLKISSPSKVMIALGRFITQGLVNGLTGTAKQVQAAANSLANRVNDAFSNKLIKKSQRNSVLSVLSNGTRSLLALVNQSNSVTAKLKVAQANLKTVQDAYNKANADAAQKVKDSFSIVTPGATFINIPSLKAKFAAAVKVAQDFATNIATLTKRGLNQDLLSQLADAGAVDAGALAKALANASDQDLKDLGTLQAQLNTAAGGVGKSVADALYGAGVRAAQGLVAGLQSQEKAIDKQMLKIANSMAAAIKKALKIKSPSRVMADLGRFISQGLIDGIRSLTGGVRSAALALAQTAIAPTIKLGAPGSVASDVRSGFGGSAAAAGSVLNYNQTVNALPGMDAKQVADYGFTKLKLAARTGVNAVVVPVPAPAGV